MRLKASFPTAGFPRQARVVPGALKRHGMVLADDGSIRLVTGAPAPGWSNGGLRALSPLDRLSLRGRRYAIMAAVSDDRLHFTGDEEADLLLASDPLALLIGFALDQQVTTQKAFGGPLELRRRLGGLDAAAIAATPPEELDRIFREKPALHRFPGAMAERVRDLCATLVEDYGGDARRVWSEAADARDLQRRLGALPGFGEMKVRTLTAVLAKRLGVRPPGIEEVLPDHPSLGDVDSAEALARYQASKRARKAELRARRSA